MTGVASILDSRLARQTKWASLTLTSILSTEHTNVFSATVGYIITCLQVGPIYYTIC